MNILKRGLLNCLLAVSFCPAAFAESNNKPTPSLSSAYLSHWFTVDSAEPSNFTLTPLNNDSIGRRDELRFTSDDGEAVNGLIAYPANEQKSNKIAFAAHPMGANQQFWWSDSGRLKAHQLTEYLRKQGYTVISLDARRHGERAKEGFGPKELLQRAHSKEPRLYIETIIGSVRDYRTVLSWSKTQFQPSSTIAIGYSMGAQISLLLSAHEPSINLVLAMVPPYVGSPTSPVAPRAHADKISDTTILWLAGRQDPHSNVEQTIDTFNRLATHNKKLSWFESGHLLPATYVETAIKLIKAEQE